ncbi:MAG: putative metal-binding motif-containing protein [Myxococcota bacterium]
MRRITLPVLLALGSFAAVACGEADNDGDGVVASLDCDDNNAAAAPGADEICDGIDNNCDGFTDEAENVVGAPTWYLDRDVDGVGDDKVTEQRCTAQGGGWAATGGDCDDTDPAVAPGKQEVCNGKDDDCDGVEDEPEEATGTQLWYQDYDFDSFGDPDGGEMLCPQQVPKLWVRNGDDCDDLDPNQYPGADEYCNDEDDDCDKDVDELTDVLDGFDSWVDLDEDGYGDPSTTTFVCELAEGWVDRAGDCNDADDVVALGCGCTTQELGDLFVPAGRTVKIAVDGSPLHYGNIVVEEGATLRIDGFEPAYLFATKVDIRGTLDVSGDEAVAGPGGGKGGGSADRCTYAVGKDGGGGFLGMTAGGKGGTINGGGGGGGASADGGSPGVTLTSYVGGAAGSRFSDEAMAVFSGGGGGGGGAGQGAAGGGGGGALKIVAGEILISGTVDARGADGGDYTSTSCYYGADGGGGGAGGMVFLHGDRLDFTGSILIDGGSGGTGYKSTYYYYGGGAGGAGSIGRARISGAEVTNTGKISDKAYEDSSDPSCDSPFSVEEE